MKKTIVLLFLLANYFAPAQFIENFEYDNWATQAKWRGDTSKFTLSNRMLVSKNNLSNDKFYVSTHSTRIQNCEWSFTVKLQFNTSSANFVDVFLSSDSSDLKSNVSGYLVRIGGSTDQINLIRKNQSVLNPLIQSRVGLTNKSGINFKIKITRSSEGNFQMWLDSTASATSYNFIGQSTDTVFKSANFFGFLIQQSSSGFHNKHALDEFYIGKERVDSIGPHISEVVLTNQDSILLRFNEQLHPNFINREQFEINNSIGKASRVSLQSNNKELLLQFAHKLLPNQTYQLSVKMGKDTLGNSMKDTLIDILYEKLESPKRYQLLINEVLAAPLPNSTLPNAEYIELINNSPYYLNLTNCRIGDQLNLTTFPNSKLAPDSSIIICDIKNVDLFKPFGTVMGLKNFPTLNNNGDQIKLLNENNEIVHQIKYDLSSYADAIKSKGGWSLEMIDHLNPCHISNYMASKHPSGGTPGKTNSVNGNNPDNKKPSLQRINIPSPNQISLYFDEPLDDIRSTYLNNFKLEETHFDSITYSDNKLYLYLETPLTSNRIYQLKLTKVSDCVNNLISDTAIKLGLPVTANPKNLLINELLFNPYPNEYDFIELFNPSDQVISLKGIYLFNKDEAGLVEEITAIDTSGLFILPNQYLVLTEKPNTVMQRYKQSNPIQFLEISNLPSMNDNNGCVGIAYHSQMIIDEVTYSDQFHFELITNKEGVALEKINEFDTINSPHNWTSAAASYGYATPGRQNSHAMALKTDADWLSLSGDYITPDEDGDQDLLLISINSNTIGQTVSIKIFDLAGRQVVELANNLPIGVSQTWIWDGLNSVKKKLPIGIYILYVERFGIDGKRYIKKKAVTVGGKLH